MAGFPIVLSGASGVGKTALGRLILDAIPTLVESISFTTREPRKGEEEGIDYHFITEKEFLAKIGKNEFIEWAKVHNGYYGTSAEWIKKTLNEGEQGQHVFTILDVQGGLQLRDQIPNACLIFLLPPSMQALEKRLRKRGTDDENAIKIRMENAPTENEVGLDRYDYAILNSKLDVALGDVLACIRAHRIKMIDRKFFKKQLCSMAGQSDS